MKNPEYPRMRGGRFILCVAAFLTVTAFLFAPARPAGAAPAKVIVLTDAAGLGDKGFNDVCWQGVLKASREFGFDARFLQAREQADYASNLTLAAGNADIVVTLGYLFVDSLKQVAPHFPNTRFIHIEGEVRSENLACYDFRSEEGGFLAGIVAGLFTKKNIVGVVTGMDIPPVEAYVSGFRAGVKTAEKARGVKIEVSIAPAGSFNDPVKGKSLAKTLIDRGAGVIFRVAGNTGVGVSEAVKSADGVFLVAEDLDQDGEMPGKILASTLKRMDVAIFNAIRDSLEGRFKAGHFWLGAAEGAIDLSEMKYSAEMFAPADLERIGKAKALLRSGELAIPKRLGEVESFVAPEL